MWVRSIGTITINDKIYYLHISKNTKTKEILWSDVVQPRDICFIEVTAS